MLHAIIRHRSQIEIPEHIGLAAVHIWKSQGKDKEFLETNCEITTHAIKDMLTPGKAYTEWIYSKDLPEDIDSFEVVFGELGGEDHFMFIIGDKIYQSYAFSHGVQESDYDKSKSFWEHVSCDKEKYRSKEYYFIIRDNSGERS